MRNPEIMTKSPISDPTIAIIIVVLNGAKTLQTAIESVLNQTYEKTELIIIDGGSTDGTLLLIEKYNSHIKYFISKPDNGIYDAMNYATDHCNADWCLFLGCDDVLTDCLHLVSAKMIDSNSIYYGQVIKKSKGVIYAGKFSKLKLTYKNICHQAIFYPKAVFRHKYDTRYRLHADYNLNIQLWGSKVPFVYVDHIITYFNDTGSSSGGDPVFRKVKGPILRKNFGLLYSLLWSFRELYKKIKSYFRYAVRG